MKKRIIDLTNHSVSRVDLTPAETEKRENEAIQARNKKEIQKIERSKRKVFKDVFIQSLSPNARKGFEAIIEDGNLD